MALFHNRLLSFLSASQCYLLSVSLFLVPCGSQKHLQLHIQLPRWGLFIGSPSQITSVICSHQGAYPSLRSTPLKVDSYENRRVHGRADFLATCLPRTNRAAQLGTTMPCALTPPTPWLSFFIPPASPSLCLLLNFVLLTAFSSSWTWWVTVAFTC